MIEEEARVVAVEVGRVWVERQRAPACGQCAETCVTALAARSVATRTVRIPVSTTLELAEGDLVMLGIREDALLKGAMAVYLLPLLFLFGGALLGYAVVDLEWGKALGGASGLGFAFTLLKIASRRNQSGFEPVILHKIH